MGNGFPKVVVRNSVGRTFGAIMPEPCVAGICARVDSDRGVPEAPAEEAVPWLPPVNAHGRRLSIAHKAARHAAFSRASRRRVFDTDWSSTCAG